MDLDTDNFSINIVGESTGLQWTGDFVCNVRQTKRQELQVAAIARELLGPNPDKADPRARSVAEIIAECQVSFKSVPPWFKDKGFGLDLADDNVLEHLWAKIVEVRLNAIKKVKEKAAKANATLEDALKVE